MQITFWAVTTLCSMSRSMAVACVIILYRPLRNNVTQVKLPTGNSTLTGDVSHNG